MDTEKTASYQGQERPFGFVIALILFVVGLWRLTAGDGHAGIWLAGALGLAVATAVFPAIWRPVLRIWMPLAHVLGRINTAVLLGAVFFLMIVPMGWLLRLVGHDPLRLRRPPLGGDWVERGQEWTPATFKDQF